MEACSLIAQEALATGVARLTIEHHGDWWVIWSKLDWLSGADHRRAFREVVRHPFLANSMRQEILLTTFGRDVVSVSLGEMDVVKGAVDAELQNVLAMLQEAERVVAFRV